MKKKTTKKVAKKVKKTVTPNEQATIALLKSGFKEHRKEGDYDSLGTVFFNIFLTVDRKSELYKVADKLWLSLSKEEQEMCG